MEFIRTSPQGSGARPITLEGARANTWLISRTFSDQKSFARFLQKSSTLDDQRRYSSSQCIGTKLDMELTHYPPMEAGVADHVCTLEEVVTLL